MTGSPDKIGIFTTDGVPEKRVTEAFGLVRGSTVRAKHFGTDFVASLRNLVGGEMTEYSSLLTGAREQAVDRMIREARTMGAHAVVGVRFETSLIAAGASEVMAYGTAVKLSS